MVKDNSYYDFLEYAFKKNQEGVSWEKLSVEFIQKFNTYISRSCLRHRAQRLNKKGRKVEPDFTNDDNQTDVYIQYNADGSVESKGKIECNSSVLKDPIKLLEKLGYDSDKWELITYRVSEWEGGKVDDSNKFRKQHAIRYKVKPKNNLSINDYLSSAQKAFSTKIMPLLEDDVVKIQNDELDDNKLMEIAPIELHLGKLAHDIETGENYDLKIAKERFEYIFEKIREKQRVEKCGKCVLIIGSDFFNSESDNCTSINKIPQQNDSRYIKLFTEAIKMYTAAIFTLKNMFNSIDVMLCAGNHARAMETFLYIALQQRFSMCDYIRFIENYKHTQVYEFGKCAIFYNHGDANLKQTIKSIPAEFDKSWGTHPFRELHLGHLHKEVVVDDDGGMITRRIGAPCSTDAWHYDNRFVGSIKKHQIFVWNKNSGLENIYYIPIY